MLAHPIFVSLGECTLEVYLFQAPLRELLLWLVPPLKPPLQELWRGLHWTEEVFLWYLFLLWTLSSVFAAVVARPLQRWVHRYTTKLASEGQHPEAEPCL